VLFGDPVAFLVTALFLVPAVIVGIPAHELGHAYAASLLGDRSSLNRVRHNFQPRFFFEPYGVLAAFLANVSWPLPIPVNEARLRGRAQVLYALAGPAANLAIAVVFGLVVRFLIAAGVIFNPGSIIQTPLGYVEFIAYAMFFLNLAMFAFNLLPIPGLDGWRILETLFRRRNPRFFFDAWSRRREVWTFCAIAVVLSSFLLHINLLGIVVAPFFEPFSQLILGRCAVYTSLQPCLL
jgi:Zn-dependent protease